MRWVRDLIADLRGGIPAKCDGCDKEVPPEDLCPVSGGEWMCPDCLGYILGPQE